MAIGPLQNLNGLNCGDLYSVYAAIARADHGHRLIAMFGDEKPPRGHWPLRLLSVDAFTRRWDSADSVPGGRDAFARGLSRRAAVYGIDVNAVIARKRTAA
ncbi:hypothetical protein [Crateriforma conspicua]|uniref:Uncharacterized protein n=1 Tax=Crateriforma conspicua TaxID=2527996 RepID=A0A5C5XQN6_9PLAN|nr:hypothetical protein [Crateriforma conspicua]TWT65507.1 hypothetical protein Pan14r_50530 [Crateriforma conspicua]